MGTDTSTLARLPEIVHSTGLRLPYALPSASTGTHWLSGVGAHLDHSPVDGGLIAEVAWARAEEYEKVIQTAEEAFRYWRLIPAPRRGEVVRQIGMRLRQHKPALGALVAYEMGKPMEEALGEVQEMIDMADYAVGLSRQIHGRTMHSERPHHRMYEQYHPLGIVGIVSAFNFPVAVWSWNSFLAWVCGNVCLWKPSEKTPISAFACQQLVSDVLAENDLPEGISNLVIGDAEIGIRLAEDGRIPLVSATGSVRMGQDVAQRTAKRLGRSLLELGGNNALLISNKAPLDLAIHAAVFGAIGTSGQRCTTTRRLLVQRKRLEEVQKRLVRAYDSIQIGTPMDTAHHMGPLIDEAAVKTYLKALERAKQEGAKVWVEGGPMTSAPSKAYVRPAVYQMPANAPLLQEETFAPLLFVIAYDTLEEAIQIQNNVPQGLSSALMTQDLIEAERFLAHDGSDCGIANINIGTSGAEIGGAFGGEKHTGGGREAGSDAWKNYMRRQTNTINYGEALPLAQGIRFNL